VADRQRLEPGETGFEEATLVIDAVLGGVHVAQVDLHPGDPVVKSRQPPFHDGLGLAREPIVTFDRVVRVDLDLRIGDRSSLTRSGLNRGEIAATPVDAGILSAGPTAPLAASIRPASWRSGSISSVAFFPTTAALET
jgi:hypothetical protein